MIVISEARETDVFSIWSSTQHASYLRAMLTRLIKSVIRTVIVCRVITGGANYSNDDSVAQRLLQSTDQLGPSSCGGVLLSRSPIWTDFEDCYCCYMWVCVWERESEREPVCVLFLKREAEIQRLNLISQAMSCEMYVYFSSSMMSNILK